MKAARIEKLEPRRLLSFTPFGSETVVNPPSPGTPGDTRIAVAGDGSYLVASLFADPVPIGVSATDLTITASRYSASGQAIGAPLVLQKLTNSSAPGIAAAMDEQGDAVVAYSVADTATTLSVHVIRISNQGVTSAPALVSVADTRNGRLNIAVSMDARGDYFVGWTLTDAVTGDAELHTHAYDAGGVSRGPEIKAVVEAASFDFDEENGTVIVPAEFSSLAIAANPDGSGAVYAFTDNQPSGARLRLARVGRVGVSATIGQPGTLPNFDPTVLTQAGDIAVHPDGSFVISYLRLNSQAYPSAYLQRFDATAQGLGDPIDFGVGANGQFDIAPALAPMPDGGFVAAFTNVFQHASYAYARHYDASGVSLDAAPVEIRSFGPKDGHFDYLGAHVGADDAGNVVVLYLTSHRYQNDFIRYRRLTTDIAAIDQSILYAFGTKVANSISVTSSKSQVVVHSDAAASAFDASQIQAVSITGGPGDDRIVNDTALPATLDGGSGNDTIRGGSAADAIYGRAGNDRLCGQLGADRIDGNGGRDRLFGGGGDDRIFGGAGGDWLYSQGGNDQLFGEGGSDRLYADYATGSSTLHGGAGNDVLITANGLVDQLFGDGGHDAATADGVDVLTSIEE